MEGRSLTMTTIIETKVSYKDDMLRKLKFKSKESRVIIPRSYMHYITLSSEKYMMCLGRSYHDVTGKKLMTGVRYV